MPGCQAAAHCDCHIRGSIDGQSIPTISSSQKVLLAIFGVAIMIAFVLSGALPNLGGSSTQARKNEVVVTTEYGPLRESDLYNMVVQRRAVDQVLQMIVNASIGTLVKNQQIDPRRASGVRKHDGAAPTGGAPAISSIRGGSRRRDFGARQKGRADGRCGQRRGDQ